MHTETKYLKIVERMVVLNKKFMQSNLDNFH